MKESACKPAVRLVRAPAKSRLLPSTGPARAGFATGAGTAYRYASEMGEPVYPIGWLPRWGVSDGGHRFVVVPPIWSAIPLGRTPASGGDH